MIWEGFERELFLQIINHSSLFSSMKESIKNDKVVTKKYLVYFLHPQPLGSILLLIFEADWFQEFSSMRTLFVWNFIQFTCFYVCEWERERERESIFSKNMDYATGLRHNWRAIRSHGTKWHCGWVGFHTPITCEYTNGPIWARSCYRRSHAVFVLPTQYWVDMTCNPSVLNKYGDAASPKTLWTKFKL
jgi:hypothetical protein